jgi:hypothetical protein
VAGESSNLKPAWQPGQSGNPSGRPKDYITRYLRARMEVDGEKFAAMLWNKAMKRGDLRAAIEIYDRVEGKVPVSTTLEGGIEVVVRRADRHG